MVKVYLVGAITDYLGSGVHQLTTFPKEVEREPKYNHNYFDKVGNSVKTCYYFETEKEADKSFFLLVRKVKERHSIKHFPDDFREKYNEVFDRAMEKYPEVIL